MLSKLNGDALEGEMAKPTRQGLYIGETVADDDTVLDTVWIWTGYSWEDVAEASLPGYSPRRDEGNLNV